MPNVHLHVKPGKGIEHIGKKLAHELLPAIVAKALSLENQKLHAGKVTPNEVMVIPFFDRETVNGKDIEIHVFAHNYLERVNILDELSEQIRNQVAQFLSDYDRNLTAAVCLMLVPMGYAEIKDR